jgi:AAA+ superfamily predicted ATPase
MTILFKGLNESISNFPNDQDIVIINRDKKVIINPLEVPDDEEREIIIERMMKKQPTKIESEFEIGKWTREKSLFGKEIVDQIGKYKCSKFKINFNQKLHIRKRVIEKNRKDHHSKKETAKTTQTKKTSSMWVSKEFPLQA